MLNMVLMDTEKLPKKQGAQMIERLGKLGNLKTYPSISPDKVVELCADAEVLLTNKNPLTEEHFSKLPKLKYVVVIATGYDNVDVAAAKKHGVKVSNLPGYSGISVAQHTIALLLEISNQVGKVNQMVKGGKWYGTGHQHLELHGLTLGLFGFGNIAQLVARIALSLGMQVLVCSSKGKNAEYATDLPVRFVDKQELLKSSDVISLHCPVTPATREMINRDTLAQMKPNTILINASRGALINEHDLYQALSQRTIAAAALDVVQVEPIPADNPLLTLDNCIFSPHNAWVSGASLARWVDQTEDCVRNYLQGKFIQLV